MSIKAFNPRKLLKAVTTGSPVRRAVIAVNILLVLVSLLLLGDHNVAVCGRN